MDHTVLDLRGGVIEALSLIRDKQDRRWNAGKPSGALDTYIPHMINHFVSQSKTY